MTAELQEFKIKKLCIFKCSDQAPATENTESAVTPDRHTELSKSAKFLGKPK
jgi:hypothetical protein